jgi:polysaccharide export outer membrane protein
MRHLKGPSLCIVLCSTLLLTGCFESKISPKQYESPSGFLLGPEDVLEITVWGNKDLTRTTPIRPDGLISMPIIGDVQAAGLTADALAKRIAERLKAVAMNPTVSVAVTELNSYSVYVLGEVTKPGKYQFKSYVTVLQAISTAGGFTDYAKKNRLQVLRVSHNGDEKRQEVHIPLRYDDLVSGRGEPGNIVLHPGDTVVVP